MGRRKYPKTQEEAFAIIDSMLTDEEKKDALKTLDDEDFAMDQHFDLGAWVRNNWIYGGKVDYDVLDGEKTELQTDKPFSEVFILRSSPDNLSCKFVSLYHKHLRETYKSGD